MFQDTYLHIIERRHGLNCAARTQEMFEVIQKADKRFHLYISVILCTRGATGYFTFILVLYYAPEAPRVISGRFY